MTRARTSQFVVHLLLAVGALFMLAPYGVMVTTALTPRGQLFSSGFSFGSMTLDNFRAALDGAAWTTYYTNGVIVVGCIFVVQVALCLPAGYALARLKFRLRGVFFAAVIVALLVPNQITALPTFIAISRVGLIDTLPALILPFLGSAFAIFLFRQYVLTIPAELFDAARMDGVHPRSLVWRVVLPNAKPAIAALAVFSIVSHWNELFWPSIVVRTDASATVPYGIAAFSGGGEAPNFGVQMAAACLAVAPLVVLFLLLQRNFVQGIAIGHGR